MAGIDGQSRASDEAVERRVQARYEQKMAKCGRVAEQNNLTFIPAVFLHTGQIHCASKRLIKEQIRQKLMLWCTVPICVHTCILILSS